MCSLFEFVTLEYYYYLCSQHCNDDICAYVCVSDRLMEVQAKMGVEDYAVPGHVVMDDHTQQQQQQHHQYQYQLNDNTEGMNYPEDDDTATADDVDDVDDIPDHVFVSPMSSGDDGEESYNN